MLHVCTYRQHPDVFTDRREQRYLTQRESAEFAAITAPGLRKPWLLVRIAVKTLAQHFLSSEHDLWLPENSIDVLGPIPSDGQCTRLQIVPEGPYQGRGPQDLVVRVALSETCAFTAIERGHRGLRFSLAIQPIDAGFPFFLDEPFTEEEISQLSSVEEEYRNAQVAASVATKRALLAALTPVTSPKGPRAPLDGAEVVVGSPAPGQPVAVSCPPALLQQRSVQAWTDVVPSYACAYVALTGPDYDPQRDPLSEARWMKKPHDPSRS